MEITTTVLSRLYDQVQNLDVSSLNRPLAVAIALVLAMLLAYQLYNSWLTLNYQPTLNTSVKSAKVASTSYQASSLTKANLFGRSLASNNTESSNIPVTRLQLRLRGAFTSSNPKNASALIEGPDGKTQSYKVASKVYGQALLHQVLADRIVLSRNGELETLYFPEPGSEVGSAGAATPNGSESAGFSAYTNAVPNDIRQLVQDNMSLAEIQQASKQLRSSAMTPQQRKELISKRLQELRNRVKAKNK